MLSSLDDQELDAVKTVLNCNMNDNWKREVVIDANSTSHKIRGR